MSAKPHCECRELVLPQFHVIPGYRPSQVIPEGGPQPPWATHLKRPAKRLANPFDAAKVTPPMPRIRQWLPWSPTAIAGSGMVLSEWRLLVPSLVTLRELRAIPGPHSRAETKPVR